MTKQPTKISKISDYRKHRNSHFSKQKLIESKFNTHRKNKQINETLGIKRRVNKQMNNT